MIDSHKWNVEGDDRLCHCPGLRIGLEHVGLDHSQRPDLDRLPPAGFMQGLAFLSMGDGSADKLGDAGPAALAHAVHHFLAHLAARRTIASPDWMGSSARAHREGKFRLARGCTRFY